MSTSSESAYRLIHESSPYLRQHAGNPVNWYPWGPEGLEQARLLDRPIFLSIGYSACHWCHVMERESFEDHEVARILNEHFISIKVDREERPDLDHIYMAAVQMMTGQGGWPMSMFLAPDLKPFYGGTYFPPEDRYGRPSFKRLLLALADAWANRRDEVLHSAGQIGERLQAGGGPPPAGGELEEGLLRGARGQLRQAFDPTFGGFGRAPKFPHPMDVRLLLRIWRRFGDEDALGMARLTLDRMATGGIYDHLGGGFHRYSTDERWLVPHFEKMLYDNALLAVAYLEAYQATGEQQDREIVEEILDYVRREMTSPEGAFYSTQDADSEGEEGRFFVWSAAEVADVLGPELAAIFGEVYDVTPEGNWEGRNILHRGRTYSQEARLLDLPEQELRRRLEEARDILLRRRAQRVWPARDEKVLTAWNALMIDAFARAAQALEEPRYAETAARAADFLLRTLRAPDGRLLRTYGAGAGAKLNAYLDDYAFLIEALVSLYEATFAPGWLEVAVTLAEVMVREFWDDAGGGFFYTGQQHELLIVRPKDFQDSSTPSGNAMAATGLLRLAALTGRVDFQQKAESTLRTFQGLIAKAPTAAGQMLMALDFWLGPVREVAVIGDLSSEDTRRVLRAIRSPFRPNQIVTAATGSEVDRLGRLVPLLAGKQSAGPVTTFLCQNFACLPPLVGSEAAKAALAQDPEPYCSPQTSPRTSSAT